MKILVPCGRPPGCQSSLPSHATDGHSINTASRASWSYRHRRLSPAGTDPSPSGGHRRFRCSRTTPFICAFRRPCWHWSSTARNTAPVASASILSGMTGTTARHVPRYRERYDYDGELAIVTRNAEVPPTAGRGEGRMMAVAMVMATGNGHRD